MEHKNFFSARRKPPAIFDQKDFPVILAHSVPQVEILLFRNEKGIVYHLPTCNSIAGLGSLILILILSHIFEASTVEVSVNGSNICEWIKYL